jgi:predicted transcriptional regulator
VVNDERVVFGLLRSKELEKGTDEPVEKVMRPGPSAFRPFVPIEQMALYMLEHDLDNSPITTSDGRLVGLLRKEDAERAVHLMHEAHRHHETAEGTPGEH